MPEIGDIVGQRYSILGRIASGGMGSVYHARHLLSRRDVALKVLHMDSHLDPSAAERFRREASAAADVGHDGLVQVLDAGIDLDRGRYFIAMELLEGEDLALRLRREGTTLGDALTLILRMLEPLGAMHQAGYVHRDLKPENVFVLAGDSIKLLDFGVAKHLHAANATLTGAALGTPHYMAPEQILDAKSVSTASDVWAVGVMLYEVATGRRPFLGETPAILIKTCMERPEPVRDLAEHVGDPLGELIDRCLAREPGLRPADAGELARALRAAIARDPGLEAELELEPRPPSMVPATQLLTTVASTPTTDWQTVRGPDFVVQVPQSWQPRPTLVPHVVTSWEAGEDEAFRPRFTLKIEAWDKDTKSFVTLGVENMSQVSRLVRTADVMFVGEPGVEVHAICASSEPRQHWLRHAVVVGDRGYLGSCDCTLDRFDELAPTFRAILASVRTA